MRHHHIDVGSVLRGTVCALYSNLVTRPTGAAVRTEIERAIAEIGGHTVTVIDFSEVTLLDFSCADEIVAKLMLRTEDGYFLFRGLGDRHLDAVEAVLERHRLAIVAVFDGVPSLIGEVSDVERATWEVLRDERRATPATVAATRGERVDDAARLLDALARRGLAVCLDGEAYAAVGTLGSAEAAA